MAFLFKIKKQDLTEDKIRHAAVCIDHFIYGKVTRLQLTMRLHIIVGNVLKSELRAALLGRVHRQQLPYQIPSPFVFKLLLLLY